MVSCRAISQGFMLLELLIVLLLVAVLAAFAVPGFGELRRSVGISTGANQMVWALHYARSAALLRGLPTVVCLSADGMSCLAGASGAGAGWIIFHDRERGSPIQFGGADELLRDVRLSPGFTVRGTRAAVTYWPASRAGTTATFTVCAVQGRPEGRSVVVSQTGRPRAGGAVACAP